MWGPTDCSFLCITPVLFQPRVIGHSEASLLSPLGTSAFFMIWLRDRFDGIVHQGVSGVSWRRLSRSKQFTAGWKSLAMWFYDIIPNHSARNPSSWPIDEMATRKKESYLANRDTLRFSLLWCQTSPVSQSAHGDDLPKLAYTLGKTDFQWRYSALCLHDPGTPRDPCALASPLDSAITGVDKTCSHASKLLPTLAKWNPHIKDFTLLNVAHYVEWLYHIKWLTKWKTHNCQGHSNGWIIEVIFCMIHLGSHCVWWIVTLLLLTCPRRCLDVAVSHLRDRSQKLIALEATLKARRAFCLREMQMDVFRKVWNLFTLLWVSVLKGRVLQSTGWPK